MHLASDLVRIIKHFFPALTGLLKKLPDHRNHSYITYPAVILLMTRILSSIFYISSMRKTSEEFNSETVIKNIWKLCDEDVQDELPYWETINRYLEKLEPDRLQETVCRLVKRLIQCRSFEQARIKDKYWQVIIDGTQLHRSRRPLDPKSLYRVHNRGTPEEYTEYYYYVLEAKIVLHDKIIVSIMTEFVENDGTEAQKQDCERKAAARLMEKLKKTFGRLNICLCADSLYAYEGFFSMCRKNGWHYIIRYKEGSIPYIAEEYAKLKELEKNSFREKINGINYKYDYVNGIDYRGHKINVMECIEAKEGKEKRFMFITDVPVGNRSVAGLTERGRMRWKIENEGFNTQKRHGYSLEHMYSKDYQAIKNHYYLIQTGHMISQIMEAWDKLWKKVKDSMEQKHRRMLESFKNEEVDEYETYSKEEIQIRFKT